MKIYHRHTGKLIIELATTDLRCANLRNANLTGANFPIFCKWNVSIKDELIRIGCKEKTIKEWDDWFLSNKEYETKRETLEFKKIEAVYLATKIYIQHLNK